MISVKNSDQIKLMKEAGRITGEALYLAGEKVRAGMPTKQLDTIIRQHIESRGARPSFLGYGGFPGSACISINNQVIHGIPGSRVIEDGDIVKVALEFNFNSGVLTADRRQATYQLPGGLKLTTAVDNGAVKDGKGKTIGT